MGEQETSGDREHSRPGSTRTVAARTRRTCSLLVPLALTFACRSTTPHAPAPKAEPTAATRPSELGPAPEGEPPLPRVAAVRTRPPAPAVTSLAEARKAVRTGHPEPAVTYLRGAATDDLEARLLLARALSATGAYREALETLEHPSVAKDPEVARRRAALLTRVGRWRDAVALLQAAHKRAPTDLATQGQLLHILVATGQRATPEAQRLMDGLYDAYEAGRAVQPEELLAVARAALARGTKGAFHDANMVLGEAETAAPPRDGSWLADDIAMLRGEVFLEKYAGDEAAATYALVLERDAWQPDALAGMARVHLDGLDFATAAAVAKETLQVNPHHPDAHAVLAKVALVEGRHGEAREVALQSVLTVDPTHTQGLAVLAAIAISSADEAGYGKHRDTAVAHNPSNGRFFRDVGDLLGFLHLYPEADRVLAEATQRAPEDPHVRAAWGLNLLRLGDETRGREALDWAWQRDPFNERTRNMLDLYEKTIDPDYTTTQSGKLTVRLPKADEAVLAPILLASVRESVDTLATAYRHDAGPLRLEFFRDPEAFSIRTIGVPSLGAVAVCFGPVITFIGPYSGRHNLDNVIRHELAHVYAIAKSKGRVPRWFTEGLSEWESELADPGFARESAELLQQARKAGRLRRLGELELAFIRADSAVMMEVAYATAAYAIRYLGSTYGRDKLIAILEGYATGRDTADLFAQHLGKPLTAIEAEFETWFHAQLDAKDSGWSPSADKASKDPRDVLYQEAMQAFERNDAPQAVRLLERLVTRGGDGYATRMPLAAILLAGPKPQAAVRHLEAAAKFRTEAVEPLTQLAKLAKQRSDFAAERQLLQQILRIDADNAAPALRLLMLALAYDDGEALQLALDRGVAIAPLHPLVLAAGASQNQSAGKASWERAVETLQDVEQPDDDTLMTMALVAKRFGNEELAHGYAQKIAAKKLVPPAVAKALAL